MSVPLPDPFPTPESGPFNVGPDDRGFQFGTLPAVLTVAMVASVAAWAIADRSVGDTQIWQTGIYFIVIPGTMAVLLSMIRPSSGKMSVSQGTTIAILATAIVVREGFICVLMALPLIIPVVALMAWVSSRTKVGNGRERWMIPLFLLALSGEGVAYQLSTNAIASEHRSIPVTAEQLEHSLAEPAELPTIQPLLFALPFPKPTSVDGSGSDVGDRRVVAFNSGGELTLEITNRQAGEIVWTVVDNTTPVAGWMTLNTVTARWVEAGAGLDLSVEIDFDRELNPAIYFDPLERWGVGELAEVFADMLEHNAA